MSDGRDDSDKASPVQIEMGPINVKMKMADPGQVEAAIADAVRESIWVDEDPIGISELVRDIQQALVDIGCVMIQVDNS